jgi:methyltransferase (TIGR00027 family)
METGNHSATQQNAIKQEAIEQLSAVSNTALLTLWARALEARSADPILTDPAAVLLAERLRPHLAALATPLYRQLVADRLPRLLITSLALRAQYFDQMARDFLLRFPRGVVVNLGSGLDTRFERLDAASGRVFDSVRVVEIDLPPVIALKEQLLSPHPRHTLLAASVLDHSWMAALDRYDDRRLLFLAEGLLMYFPPDEVRRLVLALVKRFPGSELVADLFHGMWMRPPWRDWISRKMQRQFHFDPDASFEFGLDSPDEMAKWHPDIRFLSVWSMFDAHERKLGGWRWFRHLPLFRLAQYIVHYRLG